MIEREPVPDETPASSLPPSPFEPVPRTGWARPVGMGCGALVLIALVGLTVLALNAGRIFARSLDTLEAELLATPPEGFSADDVQRLTRAFEGARGALEGSQVPPSVVDSLFQLQEKIFALGSVPPEQRTRDDLLELAAILERIGGLDPPAPAPPREEPAGVSPPDSAAV